MEYLFNEEKVTLIVSTYASYNNLYVGLISEGEPYADITVNLEPLTDPYTAFVDTNNLPNIGKFLTDNHIAEYLGKIRQVVTVHILCTDLIPKSLINLWAGKIILIRLIMTFMCLYLQQSIL